MRPQSTHARASEIIPLLKAMASRESARMLLDVYGVHPRFEPTYVVMYCHHAPVSHYFLLNVVFFLVTNSFKKHKEGLGVLRNRGGELGPQKEVMTKLRQ